MKIELQRGDLFCVEGIGTISKLIKWRTGGVFSHAGIIVDSEGNTFEALNRLDHFHINRYEGKNIFIVRPLVDIVLIDEAIKILEKKWDGTIYPYWRLVSHLIGWPFDKIHPINIPVCSESVAYDEYLVGVRAIDNIWGINPDDLADRWITLPERFEIIKRGRL